MAADEHTLGITTVFGDVVMYPAKRLRDIVENVDHLDLGQQTVVHRYEHKSLLQKEPRLPRHVALVAPLPATAVNPEHHRRILC